jgi:hypothetical protein
LDVIESSVRRPAKNQNGKRQVVVVVRERGGSIVPAVFPTEGALASWIVSSIAKGTKIVAGEAGSWNTLEAGYEVDRIYHFKVYSLDGIYSNGAASFFSRMRRAEMGHHHHIGSISRPPCPGKPMARGSPPGSLWGSGQCPGWRQRIQCQLTGADIGSGR